MRISTMQVYTSSTNGMVDNQSELLNIQNKMSSGKEFNSLAEDPVGASRVVGLQRELAQFDMYQGNVDSSRRRLELTETTLEDTNTAMDRMRELVVQVSNGTLNESDRQTIAKELDELVDYTASLMNTKDTKGEYLFSGSKSNQQAFSLENGRYAYQGDNSSRNIQVSSSLYVQSSDSGQELFQSLYSDSGFTTEGPASDALSEYEVTDEDAFKQFMSQTGDLTLTDNGDGTFSLTDSAGVAVADANGQVLTNIAFDTSTTPASAEVDLPGVTVTLTPTAAATPASTMLRFDQPQENVLNTILDVSAALRNTTLSSDALYEQLNKGLDDLTSGQERVGSAIASVGARLNKLENAEFSNTDFKLQAEATLSSIQDLDYAAASTELSRRDLALQAAYASFSRIQGLSLFEYIG